MPITDAQVEAFARRFYPDHAHRLHRVVFEELRAAIEAAERAAWSTDMEAAPEGPSLLYLPANEYEGEMMYVDGPGGYLFDEATAWRPFPQPPAETGGTE